MLARGVDRARRRRSQGELDQDVFEGKRKQLRGRAKQEWSDLSDDDLTPIDASDDVRQHQSGRAHLVDAVAHVATTHPHGLAPMLQTIAIIVLVLWLMGIVPGTTLGGFIDTHAHPPRLTDPASHRGPGKRVGRGDVTPDA